MNRGWCYSTYVPDANYSRPPHPWHRYQVVPPLFGGPLNDPMHVLHKIGWRWVPIWYFRYHLCQRTFNAYVRGTPKTLATLRTNRISFAFGKNQKANSLALEGDYVK